MKLEAEWIEEAKEETCIKCNEAKGGRFLIVYLPNKKYAAFCEDCLK